MKTRSKCSTGGFAVRGGSWSSSPCRQRCPLRALSSLAIHIALTSIGGRRQKLASIPRRVTCIHLSVQHTRRKWRSVADDVVEESPPPRDDVGQRRRGVGDSAQHTAAQRLLQRRHAAATSRAEGEVSSACYSATFLYFSVFFLKLLYFFDF